MLDFFKFNPITDLKLATPDCLDQKIIISIYLLAHATAVAFLNGRFVEVDSVHISQELRILPKGYKVVDSELDYFCTSSSFPQGKYYLTLSHNFLALSSQAPPLFSHQNARWRQLSGRVAPNCLDLILGLLRHFWPKSH